MANRVRNAVQSCAEWFDWTAHPCCFFRWPQQDLDLNCIQLRIIGTLIIILWAGSTRWSNASISEWARFKSQWEFQYSLNKNLKAIGLELTWETCKGHCLAPNYNGSMLGYFTLSIARRAPHVPFSLFSVAVIRNRLAACIVGMWWQTWYGNTDSENYSHGLCCFGYWTPSSSFLHKMVGLRTWGRTMVAARWEQRLWKWERGITEGISLNMKNPTRPVNIFFPQQSRSRMNMQEQCFHCISHQACVIPLAT